MVGVTASVRGLVEAEVPGLVALRRELHARPELSHQEHETSARVQRELAALGIAYKAGLGGLEPGKGTGVLAHLPATEGAGSGVGLGAGGAVALRADMDALPIAEQTGKAYASRTAGVMHACGHDGHTAILLGAARVLSRLPRRPHPVTFIFQPAEEGGAGGEKMVRDGALAGAAGGGLGPAVSRVYGLHGWPMMALGEVGTRAGPLLAATDDFEVIVRGEQAHAAMPHLGRDPVVAAAGVIQALQTLASRTADPVDSLVCTVGTVHGGTANNIIPREVKLTGTVRTLRAATRETAARRLREIVTQAAGAYGCEAVLDWQPGYPMTVNDAGEAARVLRTAEEVVGAGNAKRIPDPFLGGEDFSYYGQVVPACFYLIGLTPKGVDPRGVPQLHQPEFDFNDEAIRVGVEMMVGLAVG